MAVTIKQTEGLPAAYPAVPAGLSAAAAALDADMLWQRIESYIAHRWKARSVVWIVEGEGEWTPPLTPATVSATEVWENYAWTTATLYASPLGGYELPGDGPYRITASVGSGTVPAAVNEAFRRLAEYSAEIGANSMTKGQAGASNVKYSIGSAIDVSFDRQATWTARAMQLSGAADLLRPYRRA